tara:strand:+ start:839 stop:1129 length:291 start_codon:yes stop_codon:yes gene_type:complete
MDFKLEHLLLFVVAIFLLYHLLGGCGCYNRVVDGFSSGQNTANLSKTCSSHVSVMNTCMRQGTIAENQNILNDKIDNLTLELQDIKNRLPSESITN